MGFQFIFTILFIGHLLGDYYFQSQDMTNRKDEDRRVMLKHGRRYLYVTAIPFLLFFCASSFRWQLLILIVPFSHFGLDFLKAELKKKYERLKDFERALFVTDQILHILIIGIIAYIYAIHVGVAYSGISIWFGGIYENLQLAVPYQNLIYLTCLFLFLGKPSNIIIEKIIKTNKTEDSKQKNIMRLIGIFERYLVVILVILQQYTAIAFVLTAKSIVRFEEIKKSVGQSNREETKVDAEIAGTTVTAAIRTEPVAAPTEAVSEENDAEEVSFVEKFLIGTLSSLLFAIAGGILYVFITSYAPSCFDKICSCQIG